MKKKAKAQTVAPVIVTREEMATLAGEIADLQNQYNAAVVEKNLELAEIEKKYAARLDAIQAQIDLKLQSGLDWCSRNEATEFSKARTINFSRAEVQFRRGNHKVVLRSRFTCEKVIELLKSYIQPGKPPGSKYVRTIEELNKELIIDERKALSEEEWYALGIRIVQEKSMLVTPHADATENQQRAA